jgi:hypothetical protein
MAFKFVVLGVAGEGTWCRLFAAKTREECQRWVDEQTPKPGTFYRIGEEPG